MENTGENINNYKFRTYVDSYNFNAHWIDSRPISDYYDMEDWAIPAWSLTALLGLMPKLHEFENNSEDGGCQPNLCKGWDNNQGHVVYRSSIHITDWYDDPIDAVFEMICWLKENFDIYEH